RLLLDSVEGESAARSRTETADPARVLSPARRAGSVCGLRLLLFEPTPLLARATDAEARPRAGLRGLRVRVPAGLGTLHRSRIGFGGGRLRRQLFRNP